MMTGTECDELKKFMEAESTFQGRDFCEKCTKRSCKECDLLKKKFSLQEKQAFKEIWDKVTLVKENGKLRVRSEYTYQNDPQETFKPKKSNLKEAVGHTKRLINKLRKKNMLKRFQEEIDKKIQIGKLIKLNKDEVEKLKSEVHHFCYLNHTNDQ